MDVEGEDLDLSLGIFQALSQLRADLYTEILKSNMRPSFRQLKLDPHKAIKSKYSN